VEEPLDSLLLSSLGSLLGNSLEPDFEGHLKPSSCPGAVKELDIRDIALSLDRDYFSIEGCRPYRKSDRKFALMAQRESHDRCDK